MRDANKVVFIGAAESGKTQLIRRIHDDSFQSDYKTSVDVGLFLKIIGDLSTSEKELRIWDVSGRGQSSSKFQYLVKKRSL